MNVDLGWIVFSILHYVNALLCFLYNICYLKCSWMSCFLVGYCTKRLFSWLVCLPEWFEVFCCWNCLMMNTVHLLYPLSSSVDASCTDVLLESWWVRDTSSWWITLAACWRPRLINVSTELYWRLYMLTLLLLLLLLPLSVFYLTRFSEVTQGYVWFTLDFCHPAALPM